ncbi:MAG: glucose 1-dehydrogenase [Clostridiales bacterium]|nr:glucose 1-dehydrogenase [Clostridiales bacterium]
MEFLEKLFSLKGKTAVVTGGAQGIGKVVSSYLAGAGADIVIFDLQLEAAENVAEEITKERNVRACAFYCDVTNPDMVDKTIAEAAQKMGGLDILFNNAGICQHKSALEVTSEEWLKVINVNLNGVFYMARAFGKYLIENGRKGSIINTASMSGTIVNIPQEQASYNSSKAAVKHLTKSLAVEWSKKGVRVNSISPGYIKTEMTGTVRQDWQNFWTGLIPFGRMGLPEELAGAVIYLASDASTYTSGCDMIIDGCFTSI